MNRTSKRPSGGREIGSRESWRFAEEEARLATEEVARARAERNRALRKRLLNFISMLSAGGGPEFEEADSILAEIYNLNNVSSAEGDRPAWIWVGFDEKGHLIEKTGRCDVWSEKVTEERAKQNLMIRPTPTNSSSKSLNVSKFKRRSMRKSLTMNCWALNMWLSMRFCCTLKSNAAMAWCSSFENHRDHSWYHWNASEFDMNMNLRTKLLTI